MQHQFTYGKLQDLLVSLQQERSSFAAPDVPHDDAVVRGPWEEQPLDGVPPQGSYTTWNKFTEKKGTCYMC